MLIVTGHLLVAAHHRDDYVRQCADLVRRARSTPGCLDYAVTADSVDPARVNVSERWASRADCETFRGDGPDAGMLELIERFAVSEYAVGTDT